MQSKYAHGSASMLISKNILAVRATAQRMLRLVVES
jgi:hypothetical protein